MIRSIFLFLTLSSLLFCMEEGPTGPEPAKRYEIEEQNESSLQEEYIPWFTAPLLAPRGTAVPYGELEINSYVFFNTNIGNYNSHWESEKTAHFFTLNPQEYCYFGLTPWMDLQIFPQFLYQVTEGKSRWTFGDLPIGLDFQLYPADEDFWFPGIKFTVNETFPTGKFQNLNPNQLGTDSSGKGSFSTTLNLVLYKIYHIYKHHFLSFTSSSAYQMFGDVNVSGFNTYGGGYATKGRVSPGNVFTQIVSFELSLSQNWALALDNVWTHTDRTQFFGDPGVDDAGDPLTLDSPSSEELSFCPAIEYNFSQTSGIIGGCWFTAKGRNTFQYRNAVINCYFYF